MNIFIGENIKKFRKAKGITQEKLAEHLNISCQAISKWERSDSYPDISMIVPLAAYFGISTDELLGVDAAKNEQKIQEYLKKYYELGAFGKTHEKFELIVRAHNEFPNDFRIMEQYAWQLNYDPNCTDPYGNVVHKDELYSICNRILDDCTLDSPRYSALSILSGLYMIDGKIDKAIETAKRFPKHYIFTANEECENIYKRGSDEWWPLIQENIQNLASNLSVKIRNCALHSKLPPGDKIAILKKAIAVLETIYDEGDYNFVYYNLGELNIWIAGRYIEMSDFATAIEYLEKGMSHYKSYDELPVIRKHISFLVNRLTYDKMQTSSGFETNSIARELEYLKDKFYDPIRSTAGFVELIEKYTPYAKANKI